MTPGELERLDDGALGRHLEAVRAEELRRLDKAGLDPMRARFFEQTEKLATLGVLARGLAHEFNNMLSGVIAHCDYALQTGEEAVRTKALEVALLKSREASIMVKNIQRFARQEPGQRVATAPREVVERTLQLLGPSLKAKGIRLQHRLDALAPFAMDPAAIQQLLLNLLSNAMQASSHGGVVEVTLARRGDLCEITVRDQGCGIEEEHLEQIFTPFFSTKGVYARTEAEGRLQGTGLGLAASYGIVRQHGGTIEVSSTLGEGATFRVKLPLGGFGPAADLSAGAPEGGAS